jgi:hypothetical protein
MRGKGAKNHMNFRDEQGAKKMLLEMCEAFLSKKITPLEFCALVQKLDAQFVSIAADTRETPYDGWLGNLYNCCDWCDERWTHANLHDVSPDMHDEVQRVKKALAK